MMARFISLILLLALVPEAHAQNASSSSSSSSSANVTINNYQRGGGDRGGHGGWQGGGQRNYYHDRRPGYRYDPGRGWYDPLISGAARGFGSAAGGWLWRQFVQPEPPPPPQPPVVIVQTPQYGPQTVQPWTPAWYAYCQNKYRSFKPDTGMYLGFDGQQHFCQ